MADVKQIEISKPMAAAIREADRTMQAAAVELENAQRRHLTAQLGQRFIAAVIQDAGYRPEEFARIEVVEAEGKVYLRAAQ